MIFLFCLPSWWPVTTYADGSAQGSGSLSQPLSTINMSVFDAVLDKLNSPLPSLSDTINSVSDKLSGTVVYNKPDIVDPTDAEVKQILPAIRNNETGIIKSDPYSFRKFSGDQEMGDDIGAYQVTSGELKSWSKQFLGKEITPDEFASSSNLQDQYMTSKVKTLLQAGATPAEVFALHRGGLTNYADPAVREQRVKTRQDYVNKAMDFMKTLNDTIASNQ